MADTYVDENGYRRFSNSGKLVHRWVAERELGRSLSEGEEVHHINSDKTDNNPRNLKVYKGKWGFLNHTLDHEDEGYD